MKKIYLAICILACITFKTFAGEGMWMPQLLGALNENQMRAMGMQISADDIYSVNHSSIKDAVLQFGSGCTGELISKEGLLVTNHHCGYSTIQSLSTIEKNYLENGYWAKTKSQEIICPGLTVTFIKEIREITSEFQSGLASVTDEDQRAAAIKTISDSLEKKYSTKEYKALIRVFYSGNKFFLFLTETFRDIRFVGAPPSSVGKFGGETDNWVWPRHTGDFSLFRIYANKDNKPADYAVDNVPFRSLHYLPVNIGGVKENDFVFVYGFPGRTTEYSLASAVNLVKEQTNPVRIAIRDLRLNIWREAMNRNDTIQLQYASKFSTVENAYKKWKGELLGFNRFQVIQQKQLGENSIQDKEIKNLISLYNDSMVPFKSISLANDYYSEAYSSLEMINFSYRWKDLYNLLAAKSTDAKTIDAEIQKLRNAAKGFYKNYNTALDQRMTAAMLMCMDTALDQSWKSASFLSFKNKYQSFVENIFSKSNFSDEHRCMKLLSASHKDILKRLKKDPAYQLTIEISTKQSAVTASYNRMSKFLNKVQRNYIAALMDKMPDKVRYPDANSTLRLSYGKVATVNARDGILYNYYTTADGIVEKNATGNPDFEMDQAVLTKIKAKDYGRYGNDGQLNVAFISSLHTTGGNSGSPVINAKGELVGVNFDRIWEGVMSDYYYTEKICRNVALDVRYMLFVIDKVYGASSIVDEMTIVN